MSQAWSGQYERTKDVHKAAREAMRVLADSSSPDLRIIFEDEGK